MADVGRLTHTHTHTHTKPRAKALDLDFIEKKKKKIGISSGFNVIVGRRAACVFLGLLWFFFVCFSALLNDGY